MLGLKAKYDAAQYEGESYQYDINGNRMSASIQGLEKKYETGNFNRLLSENGEKLEYDAEGNRIAKGDIKYFWDHRNRLVKVETPQETIEYTYDYQNRLVKRSAGKNNTHFIHDGWQIVRQCENGKPIKRFLWEAKQDELLCENEQWTLGDHLNTIREVVNSEGKVIAHCDYNAFGKRLNVSSDTLQFAYTGKLTDNTTGLQWNINRWYDSSVGRWISEDPIGFNGRDENLYRYVHNFSAVLLDVFGLVDASNLIIKDAIISNQVTTTIDVHSDYDTISQKDYSTHINLPIVLQNNKHELGYTWNGDLGIFFKSFCTNTNSGKDWTVRFRLIGIVHAVVYPLDTDTWNTWESYASDFQQSFPNIHQDIIPPYSIDDVALFQTRLVNHEDNHVYPFKVAKTFIVEKLILVEKTNFANKADALQAAGIATQKSWNIWRNAIMYSAQYDDNTGSNPTKKARSFYTYPPAQSDTFVPVW